MCIMVQVNVYHYCVHTQRVLLPSVNPNCEKEVLGRDYIMSQWCPRCRWTGFLAPFEYKEYADALPCGGYTGKVMRTVRLDPTEFVERQKEELWLSRQDYLLNPLWDFRQAQRELEFDQLREQEIAADVSDRDCSYFMEEFLPDYPHENRCEDFFYQVWPDEVPGEEDLCVICQKNMNTNDDNERCDSSEICVLPCGHYYGVGCIGGWMGIEGKSTCPRCRQKYNFFPQLDEGQRKEVPRGWNDQELTDLAPDHKKSAIRFVLIFTYFGKLMLVGILFAPFPFTSWTNIWMLTFGAAIFYCAGIQLVMVYPLSPSERVAQNRFAVCAALGNTLEVIFANFFKGAEYSWLGVVSGYIFLPFLYYHYKMLRSLPLIVPLTNIETVLDMEQQGRGETMAYEIPVN